MIQPWNLIVHAKLRPPHPELSSGIPSYKQGWPRVAIWQNTEADAYTNPRWDKNGNVTHKMGSLNLYSSFSMEKGIHFNENKQKKWHQKTDKLLWPPEFRCASKWCVGSPVTATYHDLESVVPAHVSLQSLGNAQGLQSNLEILRPVWPIQPPRVSL